MEAPGPSAQCAGLFIPLVIKHGRRAVLTPCTEKAKSSPGPVGMDPGSRSLSSPSPLPRQWAEPPPRSVVPGGEWQLWGKPQLLFTSEQGKTHVKRQDCEWGWGVQLC